MMLSTPLSRSKDTKEYLLELRYSGQETFVPVRCPEYLSAKQRRFGKQLSAKLFGQKYPEVSVCLEKRDFSIQHKWQFDYEEISGRKKKNHIPLVVVYKKKYAILPIKNVNVKCSSIMKTVAAIFGVSLDFNKGELAFDGKLLKPSDSFVSVMGEKRNEISGTNHFALPWNFLVNAGYERRKFVLRESQFERNLLDWANEVTTIFEYENAAEHYEMEKKKVFTGFFEQKWQDEKVAELRFNLMLLECKLK